MEQEVLKPAFPNAVPIVFGADDNFFIPLVVCVQSLIEHTSPENNYDIVVLANRFRPQYEAMLKETAKGRPNISIRVYDVEPFLARFDLGKLKTGHRLSLATYYRLFIPDLMRDYDKVLYIDGDTVVLEDLALLYANDVSGLYAGAVIDYNIIRDMSSSFRAHVQNVLGMEDTTRYFNAGVLLLNIAAMRRDFPLEFLLEQAELKGTKHHDQDVLNSLFYGKVRFLPPRYNSMWQNAELYSPVEGGQDAIENPAIVHYPGSGKPWLRGGSLRPAAKHYWKYALQCPYREEIIQAYRADCRRSVESYPVLSRRFLWYRILAAVLWGRRRRHYAEKVDAVRGALSDIRQLMEKGEAALPWQE